VTDAGLKELARLKSLQTLHLRGTRVTNAGLKELQSVPRTQATGRQVYSTRVGGLCPSACQLSGAPLADGPSLVLRASDQPTSQLSQLPT